MPFPSQSQRPSQQGGVKTFKDRNWKTREKTISIYNGMTIVPVKLLQSEKFLGTSPHNISLPAVITVEKKIITYHIQQQLKLNTL